jgi:hypothetical protein
MEHHSPAPAGSSRLSPLKAEWLVLMVVHPTSLKRSCRLTHYCLVAHD